MSAEDAVMTAAERIARNMFEAGAREVAMMAADGELDTLTIEDAVERARERAVARTPNIGSVFDG